MKKPFLFFLLAAILISASTLHSQTWLAEGQTWEYNVSGGWNPAMYGKLIMYVDGDTTIQGISCKRMVHIQPNGDQSVLYAYEEQERVFAWDEFPGTFVKIYDFTLGAGDTVFFQFGRKYVIEETGVAPVAGADRKYQVIQLSGNSLDAGKCLIVEGIGLLSRYDTFNPLYDCIYFFLNNSFCDEAVDGRSYRFRCFAEGGGVVHDPFGLCTLSGVSEIDPAAQMQIFPNPAQSEFTVSLEGVGPGLLQIFDAAGRLCLQISINDLSIPTVIPASGLHAGSYTIIFAGEKTVYASRILIVNW
jgi:hypothetical protein